MIEESSPSATEKICLQRSLWLFQVCCNLAQAWAPPDDVDVALKHRHSRANLVTTLLTDFEPWELHRGFCDLCEARDRSEAHGHCDQELECIYDHLTELLDRDVDNQRLVEGGKVRGPFSLPDQIDSLAKYQKARNYKAKLLSQGLNFLYWNLRENDASARIAELDRPSGFLDKISDQRFPENMVEELDS